MRVTSSVAARASATASACVGATDPNRSGPSSRGALHQRMTPCARAMRYRRMPIEIESPEQLGYDAIANNLSESSFSDMRLADYGIDGDVSRTRSSSTATTSGCRGCASRSPPAPPRSRPTM